MDSVVTRQALDTNT